MNLLLFASSDIDLTNPYFLIIEASVIIILSYLYNRVSKRTNIPSVLLLILTGICIQLLLKRMHINLKDLSTSLELLGIIGLIMIVLEAALDLELSGDKLPVIGKSLLIGFLGLILSSVGIAHTFLFTWPSMTVAQAYLYAVPLGIMSSAIIIPSVVNLTPVKKEFMIYESAFSDILGIMLFYFLISFAENGFGAAASQFTIGLVITIVVSIIAAIGLIYIFKDIKGHVKLFVLIAVLLILYSFGKLVHLSPLIIILVFGLLLANHSVFFGWINDKIGREIVQVGDLKTIEKEFHLVTVETAFVVRTFFFVEFGMTIDLASLYDIQVLLISLIAISLIYISRFGLLWLFNRTSISPELNIAPRGLITVLLFYAIPKEYIFEAFESGVLLFVIIISSLIMTYGLIKYSDPKTG